MQTIDTIAAIATPPGKGGVAIVRVSGPLVSQIATTILGKLPQPRYALFSPFLDSHGQAIDHGLALYFPGPHSFTGEDVLELHGHGGPVVIDLLLQRVLQMNARLANPGEFSERAFLNNKIDLAEAEAIADLIDSASIQAVKLAVRSLQGEFSRVINQLIQRLIAVRTYVEAAIDFPEEEIDFLSDGKLQSDVQTLLLDISSILASAKQGSLIQEGLTVVITGQPNVGKSTLLNRLTGQETAIVTNEPGTTRDVLRVEIVIDGLPIHIIDTAGIRESENKIEIEGIKRTWLELERCDLVMLLVDVNDAGLDDQDQQLLARLSKDIGVIIVRNKIDICQRLPECVDGKYGKEVLISASQDMGLDLLRKQITRYAGLHDTTEGNFMARRRHVTALENAEIAIKDGLMQLVENQAGELLAAELQQAQQHLGLITGEYTSDDLLGNIFSSFCIGK